MRHYPIRSAEQGERKVFRERKPRFDPEELARGWHVQYEGLEPGRPLLPDECSALPYDADAARVALQVRNRLIEAAYPSVVPAPPADLATTVRRIEDARARQIEQLRNLTLALEEGRRDLEALRASHAEVLAQLEQARERIATLEVALGDVRGELAKVNRDARDLTQRLDEMFRSKSWRVTKPLRAIWRMLGRT
jgi:DNA repair exonuclease SbcCD ATPase subunit